MFSFSQLYRSHWYKAVSTSIVVDLITVYSYCSCQSYFMWRAGLSLLRLFWFSLYIFVGIKTLLFFFIAFMPFLRLLFTSDAAITWVLSENWKSSLVGSEECKIRTVLFSCCCLYHIEKTRLASSKHEDRNQTIWVVGNELIHWFIFLSAFDHHTDCDSDLTIAFLMTFISSLEWRVCMVCLAYLKASGSYEVS